MNTREQELNALQDRLRARDPREALALLNARTPFRFTGVYRVDPGDVLEAVAIYDRWVGGLTTGHSALLSERYCAYVVAQRSTVEVIDGHTDRCFPRHPSNPAVSYCGAPIQDASGHVLGTLCHFDLKPCQAPAAEAEFLRAAADLFVPLVA